MRGANRTSATAGAFSRLEHAIARVARQVRPRLHRPALASVGAPPLDPAAYATLLWVDAAQSCRIGDLAGLLGVDVSTTSRQVSSLELAGLLERRSDPGDQRARLVALSPAGAELLGRARQARVEVIAELVSDWDPADVARLADLLERLADKMCEAAPSPAAALSVGTSR